MNRFFRIAPVRIPTGAIITLCLLFVAILGAVDHLTGYEISFSIFYLAPVAIASWYGDRHYGSLLALISAVVWLTVDATAGHPYKSVLILIWNASVRFGFFIIVARLTASLKQQLIREMKTARVDQLTGVLNLNGFMKEAGVIWELAKRYGHTTAIGYIDLDNFKTVNDTFGHAEGDEVLKAVAKSMRESLRSTDILGRLGGDEFAAILPETSLNGAEEVFNNIRTSLQIQAGQNDWPVTLSIGVSVQKPPYPSLEEAIRNSDELMYRTKRAGRNNLLVEEQSGG